MAFAKDRTTAVFFISDVPGKTLMIQSRFGEKDRYFYRLSRRMDLAVCIIAPESQREANSKI